MPAPVPPGFTRGPILFLNPVDEAGERRLLQRFWTDAGGYGGRIVLIAAESAVAERYGQLLRQWETDGVTLLSLRSRQEALTTDQHVQIDYATGLLLLGDDPGRLARLLGGTPLAQAIRRANAHSKTVAGIGRAGQLLCQHMALADGHGTLHFTPGLGLVNRIVLGPLAQERSNEQPPSATLLPIVAPNPFVVAVEMEANSGIAIYPDTTLEVFGAPATLLDGAASPLEDLNALPPHTALDALGIRLYSLAPGYMFNFDQRAVTPPPATDLPDDAVPTISKSSF
jgi:cyanophycinase